MWRMDVGVDIDILTKAFFYVDEPVPYKLTDKDILYIYPACLAPILASSSVEM